MTLEKAKKIKCDFVNMSQYYNGYEITDMWNMMCEQLFQDLENQKCKNCIFSLESNSTRFCSKGITSDVYFKDFGCNKFKRKEE